MDLKPNLQTNSAKKDESAERSSEIMKAINQKSANMYEKWSIPDIKPRDNKRKIIKINEEPKENKNKLFENKLLNILDCDSNKFIVSPIINKNKDVMVASPF